FDPHYNPFDTSKDTSFRADYPTHWDWRDVDGQDYVGDIRDQLNCGSCYSFGGVASMEARLRVKSANKDKIYLATQDVVSCSPYSEGCDGGFAYNVGKYAHDYGIVSLNNFAYQPPFSGVPCSNKHIDPEHTYYAQDYYYVGGYYGATDEQSMMEEIYTNGPVAVAVSVSDDFVTYGGQEGKGGIFIEAPVVDDDGFVTTDHVITCVGWGEDNGVPYWIVRNSWGRHWGNDGGIEGQGGYMYVHRGSDTIGIESCTTAYTM
ncbi:peptidase C1A, partial [Kipferlia bialata]